MGAGCSRDTTVQYKPATSVATSPPHTAKVLPVPQPVVDTAAVSQATPARTLSLVADECSHIVDEYVADGLFQRGDVMVKLTGHTEESRTLLEDVITGGSSLAHTLSLNAWIRAGDPECCHAFIYLGDGMVAEAHGSSVSAARVSVRSLNAHEGYVLRAYRCVDRELALAAAQVAETWAMPARMHYLVPVAVPLHNASFGPDAREEALEFGRDASKAGGGRSSMFCSQFVVAAFQAACVAKQLLVNPALKAEQIVMQPGMDVHATYASPLAVHAKLLDYPAHWDVVGAALVRKQFGWLAPPRPLPSHACPSGPDVSALMQALGNPTAQRWPSGEWRYARNPWTLVAFQGHLYVGSGNANNPPPAANAGPVDLWALDLRTDAATFQRVHELPEEGIDCMRVLSDGLWIPGLDACLRDEASSQLRVKGETKVQRMKRMMETALLVPADWALGSVYQVVGPGPGQASATAVVSHSPSAAAANQHRTIHNGIHVYDVLELADGTICAAVATLAGGMVAVSADRGRSWKCELTKPLPWSRTRALFIVPTVANTDTHVYAAANGASVYRWFPHRHDFEAIALDFFPRIDVALRPHVFLQQPVHFQQQLVYLACRQLIDHDSHPLGLLRVEHATIEGAVAGATHATSPAATWITLPNDALPRAVLVTSDGSTLMVLCSTQSTPTSTRVSVSAIRALCKDDGVVGWTELFHFHAPTFARSFALSEEGDLYLGLGCHPQLLRDECGSIIKVHRRHWAKFADGQGQPPVD